MNQNAVRAIFKVAGVLAYLGAIFQLWTLSLVIPNAVSPFLAAIYPLSLFLLFVFAGYGTYSLKKWIIPFYFLHILLSLVNILSKLVLGFGPNVYFSSFFLLYAIFIITIFYKNRSQFIGHKFEWAPTIAGIVLVLVAMASATLAKIDDYTPQLNAEPEPVLNLSQSGTVTTQKQIREADTSRWKIYRNDDYGFEFKYPSDWYYGEPQKTSVCLNPQGTAGDCAGLITFVSNIDLNEHYERMRKLFERWQINESEITISGIVARIFTVSGYEKGREGTTREAYFQYQNVVYSISTAFGMEEIFDGIVMSFRFF